MAFRENRQSKEKAQKKIIIDVDRLTNKTCEFTLTTRNKRGGVTASLQQNGNEMNKCYERVNARKRGWTMRRRMLLCVFSSDRM